MRLSIISEMCSQSNFTSCISSKNSTCKNPLHSSQVKHQSNINQLNCILVELVNINVKGGYYLCKVTPSCWIRKRITSGHLLRITSEEAIWKAHPFHFINAITMWGRKEMVWRVFFKEEKLVGPKHSNFYQDLLTSNFNVAREYCQNYYYNTRGIFGAPVKEWYTKENVV